MVNNMQIKETGMLIIGFALCLTGIGIYTLEPDWIINPTGAGGAFLGAGIALVLISLREMSIRNKGRIVEDERVYRIAEKASHKTLIIIIILQGISMATISVTEQDVSARTVLSLLFAITVLSYTGYYYWYKKQM